MVHLIIRNSKNAPNNACSTAEIISNANDDLSMPSTVDDECTSLHVNQDASLSTVRLIESSEGKYMLDFGVENDPMTDAFLDNHTEGCCGPGASKTYIADESIRHLEIYAKLAGVELSTKDGSEVDAQPPSAQYYNLSLRLLPQDIHQVLHSLLSLETLFSSWSTLTSAREQGLLRWKDIHNIIADVKRIIPFIAPTSDGLLYHIIQTHLTFHQFASFAKIVEDRLQRLPKVRAKVYQSSTLSVDVVLTSDQNCEVCIGCGKFSTPPITQELKDCAKDMFVSWERTQLLAGEGKVVRLGGLKEGTVYDSYIHVSRPGSEFPVESTDADVLNSHFNIETQGYHLIDVFPVFASMTEEEQRVELLASTQDKSVRLKAQADGLVIPENNCNNDTWKLYIEWWKEKLGIRYDFCMRELLFASKDQELRSNARKDGIAMSHVSSKDQAKREQWARAFGSWYHKQDQEPTDDSSFQIAADAVECQANPPIQTLNLPSEVDDSKVGSLRPRFQSICSKSKAKTDEEHGHDDSLRDALVLQSISFPQPKVKVSPPTPSSITQKEPVASSVPTSPEHPPDPTEPTPIYDHEETKDTGALEGEVSMLPKPFRSSRLTIGVVGNEVGSFRHRFLRRLSTRIDTCLSLTRPKTPSSKRGIALFRAKVRLVMLLQKISNKPFSSLNDVDIFSHQQRETRSAKSASAAVVQINQEEETDDEEDPWEDGDSDSELNDTARHHCEDRLARNAFRVMRSWTQEVVAQKLARELAAAAEKRAQEEKTQAAVKAFHSFLLRKWFQSFVETVKEVEITEESVEEDTIEDTDTIEEIKESPRPEVEYMCVEDDDSCEFVSHLDTGRDTQFLRVNCLNDDRLLVDPVLFRNSSIRQRIKPLDDEMLSSMRRAKRAGASNLYDVPASLLGFNDPPKERPINCYRNREIVRGKA